MLEMLPLLDRVPEPDDYLIYPEKRGKGGRILAAYPKRRMSDPTVHRRVVSTPESPRLQGFRVNA